MPATCALKGSYSINSTVVYSNIVWRSSEENNCSWVKDYNNNCIYL